MHRTDAVSSARGYARGYILAGSSGPVLFGWSVPLLLAEPRLPAALLLMVWLLALTLTLIMKGVEAGSESNKDLAAASVSVQLGSGLFAWLVLLKLAYQGLSATPRLRFATFRNQFIMFMAALPGGVLNAAWISGMSGWLWLILAPLQWVLLIRTGRRLSAPHMRYLHVGAVRRLHAHLREMRDPNVRAVDRDR